MLTKCGEETEAITLFCMCYWCENQVKERVIRNDREGMEERGMSSDLSVAHSNIAYNSLGAEVCVISEE